MITLSGTFEACNFSCPAEGQKSLSFSQQTPLFRRSYAGFVRLRRAKQFPDGRRSDTEINLPRGM
jgi:hypothetical protein